MEEAYTVGSTVRVKWGEASRRATLACVDDGGIEVIFNDDASEAVVEASQVSKLQGFEAVEAQCTGEDLTKDAGRCREEGNCLYKLGDCAAAAERYSAAIEALGCVRNLDEALQPVIASSQRCLWLAHTTSCGASKVRLRFCRQISAGAGTGAAAAAAAAVLPAEMVVLKDRVLLVQQDAAAADLQAALYLNRSRCWLALGAPARAVQDTTLAEALRMACLHGLSPDDRMVQASDDGGGVWRKVAAAAGGAMAGLFSRPSAPAPASTASTAAEEASADARLCTAIFLRGKARVRQGKLVAAERELARAKEVGTSAQATDLERLRREILEARRDNKKLAKEVSKWCEAAMAKASPDAFAAVAAGTEASG